MLVLTRKKNQTIVINNEILLTVVDIRGDKIRLGVQAPENVVVDRFEIHLAKQRQRGLPINQELLDIEKRNDSLTESDNTENPEETDEN